MILNITIIGLISVVNTLVLVYLGISWITAYICVLQTLLTLSAMAWLSAEGNWALLLGTMGGTNAKTKEV